MINNLCQNNFVNKARTSNKNVSDGKIFGGGVKQDLNIFPTVSSDCAEKIRNKYFVKADLVSAFLFFNKQIK